MAIQNSLKKAFLQVLLKTPCEEPNDKEPSLPYLASSYLSIFPPPIFIFPHLFPCCRDVFKVVSKAFLRQHLLFKRLHLWSWKAF